MNKDILIKNILSVGFKTSKNFIFRYELSKNGLFYIIYITNNTFHIYKNGTRLLSKYADNRFLFNDNDLLEINKIVNIEFKRRKNKILSIYEKL